MTEPVSHQIVPRKVRFDWASSPLHWVPGEPFASHVGNTTHILLPIVEAWFCKVFAEALPFVTDDQVRRDTIAFMRQEAIHGGAHKPMLETMKGKGLDATPAVRRVQWLVDTFLGDRFLGLPVKRLGLYRWWLNTRVGIIAAGEHFTCLLGKFILENKGLERAGADPVMLDLLRWHGAEEVEHRAVAFDLYKHLSGAGFFSRLLIIGAVLPILTWYLIASLRFLQKQDPQKPRRRLFFRAWGDASRRDLLPSGKSLLAATWRYLGRGYNPVTEADTLPALEYLARSPGVGAMR